MEQIETRIECLVCGSEVSDYETLICDDCIADRKAELEENQ